MLGIIEDRGQRAKNQEYLAAVRDRIQRQLSSLQEGRYLYKDQNDKQWKTREIAIEPYQRSRYSRIYEHTIGIRTLLYDSLSAQISDLLRVSGNKCLFDVSAILKTYLLDVYTLLLQKGIRDVYTFELRLRYRTYDERELIHNLSLDTRDYSYVQLSQSLHTQGTVVKTKDQEIIAETASRNFDRAMNAAATYFANCVLTVYLLIVVAAFIGVASFVIRGNWNQIEPWTFILVGIPLLSYILNLVVQIIFNKQFSLKPQNIYRWLKEYKLRRLRAEFGLEDISI